MPCKLGLGGIQLSNWRRYTALLIAKQEDPVGLPGALLVLDKGESLNSSSGDMMRPS